MTSLQFLNDIEKLRQVASEEINKGIITKSYAADVNAIIALLNIVLATELMCVLRYSAHFHKAKELGARIAADEFLQHAKEEQNHADIIANRISQLGATPKMSPDFIAEASHSQYIECDNISDMIKENLIAERIAIDSYRQLIQFIGNGDPTTRRLLEEILAVEEEHADDLMDLKLEYNANF